MMCAHFSNFFIQLFKHEAYFLETHPFICGECLHTVSLPFSELFLKVMRNVVDLHVVLAKLLPRLIQREHW